MYKVESTDTYTQDRETIWKAYTDHARWNEWTFVQSSFLETEGSPDKNGVGAVRSIGGGGPFNALEEITLFEPYERMEYRVVKGPLPFKNHHGVVEFSDDGNGTRIHWYCTFESKIPGMGWLMKTVTQKVFDSTLKGLHNFPFDQLD